MGLASFTRRLTRRRAQLSLFSGLAVICLVAVTFLSTQVFMKLDDYAAANQDDVPYTLSRLEVEQLKLLAALRAMQGGDPESLDLVHRRFDALYSRRNTVEMGRAYRPVLEDARAAEALDALAGTLDAMARILDGADSGVVQRRDELIGMANAMTPAVRQLAISALSTTARIEEQERRALTNKLLQVTGLSILLLVTLASLAALLWQLYRLYRQRALENRQVLNRLATILDTSQDAVLVVAEDGQVIDSNRAADVMFFGGKRPVEPPSVSDILLRKGPDGSLGKVSGEKLHASCAKGPNLCANVMGRAPDGQVFPVEMSADIAQRAGRKIVICFLRNITRRVADQSALLAARDKALSGEQARARFLGMISHEMRTPLTGMLGALDLLEDTPMSEQQKSYAKIMQSSGNLLLNQINDALDLAQADHSKLSLNEEVFDLDEMLQTLQQNQLAQANKAGNTLRLTHQPGTLGHVLGDRRRLHQVLLNLISNAIKFTRNGQIGIEAVRHRTADGPAETVEFQISDTGIGIAEEAQSRIFDDFVRLESADAHEAEGTGLGLGIVRNLVTLMGGEIGVESEPGEGSLFWVRLPLPATAAGQDMQQVEAEAGPERQTTGPCDVLIVEDNAPNRAVLSEMLSKDGHRIWQAGDGAEAIAAAAARRFDVILMDINMPVLDGITAARCIREQKGVSAKARIIALTAHAGPDILTRTRAAGIEEVLTKPLRRDDLSRALLGVARPAPAPQLLVLDGEVLQQQRNAVSADTLAALLDEFEARGSALAEDPAEGLGVDDHQAAARLHELAGLAATVGARSLHGVLSQAEQALRAGDRQAAEAALAELPALWQATQAQLAEKRSAA